MNNATGIAAGQKFQLMQAFQNGNMTSVNNILKGKGFANAFKMQGKQALNLVSTVNTPDFSFGKLNSFSYDMSRQIKNITSIKNSGSAFAFMRNLQTSKTELTEFIDDLKLELKDLGVE